MFECIKYLSLSDLRQSRQSLVSHGQFDGRQSRASKRSIHRQPSRSRSRDRLTTGGPGYMGNVDPRDQNDPRDPRDDDSLGEDSDENWAGTSTDNNWTDYVRVHISCFHESWFSICEKKKKNCLFDKKNKLFSMLQSWIRNERCSL